MTEPTSTRFTTAYAEALRDLQKTSLVFLNVLGACSNLEALPALARTSAELSSLLDARLTAVPDREPFVITAEKLALTILTGKMTDLINRGMYEILGLCEKLGGNTTNAAQIIELLPLTTTAMITVSELTKPMLMEILS